MDCDSVSVDGDREVGRAQQRETSGHHATANIHNIDIVAVWRLNREVPYTVILKHSLQTFMGGAVQGDIHLSPGRVMNAHRLIYRVLGQFVETDGLNEVAVADGSRVGRVPVAVIVVVREVGVSGVEEVPVGVKDGMGVNAVFVGVTVAVEDGARVDVDCDVALS